MMVMDHEIIIFTPIFAVFIRITLFTIFKKRKRSPKSIYKLIDDLEKKINILISFVRKKINQILFQLLLLNFFPNLEDEVQPNDLCCQFRLHLHNS